MLERTTVLGLFSVGLWMAPMPGSSHTTRRTYMSHTGMPGSQMGYTYSGDSVSEVNTKRILYICMCLRVWVFVCVCVCVGGWVFVCVCGGLVVCVCVCVRMCIYVYLNVYVL